MRAEKSVDEPTDEGDRSAGDLALPLLPLQGTYRDPNVPLPLDVEQKLRLTANHFVSNRTLILGQTGYGKGTASALIEEFLLEAGLPCTFIDLEGECWPLKEVCANLLVVGRSAHADREYSPAQMGRLAELSVEQEFSVVLDFSGYEDEEMFALLLPYLRGLWAACERLRKPYHLVADELHELAPEEGTTPVKMWFRRIAKRGRKRGLGLIGMSQETASVDKKLIRQTDIRILLRVSYTADMATYHTLIPKVSLKAVEETVPAFPPGTAYVVVDHVATLVQLCRRRTFDPSETPKLGQRAAEPVLRTIDSGTLQLLDEAFPVSPGEETPLERLDRASLIALLRDLRQHPAASRHPTEKTRESSPGDAAAEQKHLAEIQQDREHLLAQVRQKQAHIDQLEALLKDLTARPDGVNAPPGVHIGEFRPQIKTATLEIGMLQGASLPRQDSRKNAARATTATVNGQKTFGAREVSSPGTAAPSILKTEQDLLAILVKRVGNLWPLEKRLLRWLLEHQDTVLTLTELSQKTGVPRGQLYERNLARLNGLDFIAKGQSPRSYTAALTKYWKANLASYPSVQPIYQHLWQATQA